MPTGRPRSTPRSTVRCYGSTPEAVVRVLAAALGEAAWGVEFTRPVSDEGWGLLTAFAIPGGGELALYEPRHPRPLAPGG